MPFGRIGLAGEGFRWLTPANPDAQASFRDAGPAFEKPAGPGGPLDVLREGTSESAGLPHLPPPN